MNLVILFVSALAGARLWRLFALDAAGKPLRDMYFKTIPNRYYDIAQEGASCPFCSGFWITASVYSSGLFWGHTWLWWLFAGVFAANFVSAQLNAWLDEKPITDGGGEIEVTDES